MQAALQAGPRRVRGNAFGFSVTNRKRRENNWNWSLRKGKRARNVNGGCATRGQIGLAQLRGGFHAEVSVNLARGVGFVERVEVQTADLVVEQVEALRSGPMDADPGHVFVGFAALDGSKQGGREAGA